NRWRAASVSEGINRRRQRARRGSPRSISHDSDWTSSVATNVAQAFLPVKRSTRQECLGRDAIGGRLLLGPDRSLIFLAHGGEALVHEPLDALAAISLRGVHVALGIRGNTVHGVELAGLPAAVAEAGQDFHVLALDDVDLFVGSVSEVDELLLRILRE